jgi:aspartate 1-decarboxylase
MPGDHVIIISYADYDEAELEDFSPRVVLIDEGNRIAKPKMHVVGDEAR